MSSDGLELPVVEIHDPSLRRHLRLVEDLVGDPVSDARGEGLIEKEPLGGHPAASDELAERGRAGHLEQRIESEFRDRRLVAGVVAKSDPAESPGIGHREPAAVLELQFDLPESGSVRFVVVSVEGARHPEVQQQGGGVLELQPQLLAMAAGGQHPLAAKSAADGGGRLVAEHDAIIRAADVLRDVAGRDGFRDEASSLYFWKFRHIPFGQRKWRPSLAISVTTARLMKTRHLNKNPGQSPGFRR